MYNTDKSRQTKPSRPIQSIEEKFKNRVDKVFGSLFPSLPLSTTTSPWSLSDDAVEHIRWNRPERRHDDDDDTSRRRSYGLLPDGRLGRRRRNQFEGDLDDLDDEGGVEGEEGEEAEEQEGRSRLDHALDDEDEIRSCIGFDTTFDHEDEEDGYDKVAVGREGSGERLFMNHVTGYGPQINFNNELPNSIKEVKYVARDPHANRLAAKARHREDKGTAGAVNMNQNSKDGSAALVESQVAANGELKSILKRKQLNQMEPKPKKRVRFDADCKVCEMEEKHDFMITEKTEYKTESHVEPETESLVPDYIRNPTKYRCYTFDSTEDDDATNLEAYRDFCGVMGKSSSNSVEVDCPVELPKSIQFTPRKKVMGYSSVDNTPSSQLITDARQAPCPALGIAAVEQEESEVCAMDEDEVEKFDAVKSFGSRRLSRHYRLKPCSDD